MAANQQTKQQMNRGSVESKKFKALPVSDKKRDYLTDANNRSHMLDILKELIDQEVSFSLYCIDVDSFCSINRRKGFRLGDLVLIDLYTNICQYFPTAFVFRSHGDHFYVITKEDASNKFDRVPTFFDCQSYKYSISCGMVRYPDDASTWEEMIHYSEIAKKDAKKIKGNSVSLYQNVDVEMNVLVDYVEQTIHSSTDEKWITFAYQPIVSVNNKRVEGYEVLMRWNDPLHGSIPPDVFIPIAERDGMITQLSKKLLCECKQTMLCFKKHFETHYLAVNISVLDLMSEEFIPFLRELFKENENLLEKLEFEVTETYYFNNFDMIEKKIELIQEMGIKISIDDFGTGFSSFEKLVNLKFDRIKIDQSFIRHLPHSEKDLLIINAIASLAKGMKLKVTVEGVENYRQQECLKLFCFDAYQGYHYAKPMFLEAAMAVFDEDIKRKFQ